MLFLKLSNGFNYVKEDRLRTLTMSYMYLPVL